MRTTLALAAVCSLLMSCSDDEAASSGNAGSAGAVDGGAGQGSGASAGQAGTANGGSSGQGGSAGSSVGGSAGSPPAATCSVPAQPADTSGATVVGDGSPGSCTEAALDAALVSSSSIKFNCGNDPHTISITSQKLITKDLVLDGGGKVTLSGGGKTRILKVDSSFEKDTPKLTVQNLSFVDGYTGDLPGTDTSSGGGAIFRLGGSLTVISCSFSGNVGPAKGQDVAGGAIYSIGVGRTIVVGSSFTGNRCSSGGAIGNLHNHLELVNSTVTFNEATGEKGNPGDGGNGGGVYMDGVDQDLIVCGTAISNNKANARGGGLFRVSNNGVGKTTFDRTTVADNQIPDNSESQAGGLYLQGLQLTISNSTISGNVANSGGGLALFNNAGKATLEMLNVTVAENLTRKSLGAGMAVDSTIPGSLTHLTIARNKTEGEASFAAAIAGGDLLTLKSCVIADQTKVFTWENLSCNQTHASGGGNFQWPDKNQGGQDEKPCADGITFADPKLGALHDNGGPTSTSAPAAGSPVIGAANDCPATDQRGEPRPATGCTSGAVEAK